MDRILRGEDPLPEGGVDSQEPPPELPPASPESYNHRQERLSRRALYKMMRSMGELYGPGMIMEIAAEVVSDLGAESDSYE